MSNAKSNNHHLKALLCSKVKTLQWKRENCNNRINQVSTWQKWEGKPLLIERHHFFLVTEPRIPVIKLRILNVNADKQNANQVNQASLLLHPDQEDSIIKALFHQWTRIISGDLTNTADLSWVHSTVRWPYLWWAPQASAAPSSTGGRTRWCRASLCPKTSLLPAGDPGTKTPSCCRGYKKKQHIQKPEWTTEKRASSFAQTCTFCPHMLLSFSGN